MTDWDKNRKQYREGVNAVTGESAWTLGKVFVKIALPTILFCIALGAIAYGLGWCGEAADVAREQYGPRASLAKYEWFVDQASRIDKMDQDIANYRQRVDGVTTQYEAIYGTDRKAWPPTAQAQFSHVVQQAKDDLLSVITQRNNLAREYNAQSEKFNWGGYDTTSGPKPRYDDLSP